MTVSFIAVTSGLSSERDIDADIDISRYVTALSRAGAKSLVVPKGAETKRILLKPGIRGILFTGGGDIDASTYGGRRELCKRVDAERDDGEMALFQEAYFNNIAILGICRGMQLANVALGGTLRENIAHHHSAELDAQRFEYYHSVRIAALSKLSMILQDLEAIQVNSVHHQAVRDLAVQLRVCARSNDGVIEAIEAEHTHPGFFLGVQWRPEAMPPEEPSAAAIFQAFVQACKT